jgi:hypothetical protein
MHIIYHIKEMLQGEERVTSVARPVAAASLQPYAPGSWVIQKKGIGH